MRFSPLITIKPQTPLDTHVEPQLGRIREGSESGVLTKIFTLDV